MLGDERRFDINGDCGTLDTARVGIAFRLATAGVGEDGTSGIDDVEFVIDDVCCVRAGIDGGATVGFAKELVTFLDEGAGMMVGRRIPPGVLDGFSLGFGAEGSVTGTVDETCRGLC